MIKNISSDDWWMLGSMVSMPGLSLSPKTNHSHTDCIHRILDRRHDRNHNRRDRRTHHPAHGRRDISRTQDMVYLGDHVRPIVRHGQNICRSFPTPCRQQADPPVDCHDRPLCGMDCERRVPIHRAISMRSAIILLRPGPRRKGSLHGHQRRTQRRHRPQRHRRHL